MTKQRWKAQDADGRWFSWAVRPDFNVPTGCWFVGNRLVRSDIAFEGFGDPPNNPESTLERMK